MEKIRQIISVTDDDFRSAKLPKRVSDKLFLNRSLEPQLVAIRLNLNYKLRKEKTAYSLQTIHAKNARGRALGYDYAVVVEDAFFAVDQATRAAIASGRAHKSPMAAVVGTLVQDEPFYGIEIRFNPKTGHLFATVDGNLAVKSAKRTTIFNTRVYAEGIEYWDENEAPEPLENIPSDVTFSPLGTRN